MFLGINRKLVVFFTVLFLFCLTILPKINKKNIETWITLYFTKRIFRGPLMGWFEEMVRTAYVERTGKIIYAGLGTSMGVFEMAPEGRLSLIKRIPLVGFVHGFSQVGDVLYVVSGATGLTTFDISNPEHPRRLGRYLTQGYALGIAVSSGYAYIGDEEKGVVILDVRNPRDPQLVKRLPGGNVNFILVHHSKAYLADGMKGVVILDVANPEQPKVSGVLDISHKSKPKPIDVPPLGLALYGHYLLVANGNRGLDIVDVRDSTKPQLVSNVKLGGFAYSVVFTKGLAYVADIVSGVAVVDVRRPSHPEIIGYVKTPGQAFDVILWDEKLLISDGAGGLRVMDASPPLPHKTLAAYAFAEKAYSVEVKDSLAYVAFGTGGMKIFNVSSPLSTALMAELETPGLAHKAVFSDSGDLYVADVIGGVQVVDVKRPEKPRIRTHFDFEEHPWDVASSGNLVFIADAHHGFTVFRKEAADYFTFLSNYDLQRYSVGVKLRGDLAFVCDMVKLIGRPGGLFVFNVSRPEKPELIGNYDTRCLDLVAKDEQLYLASYERGLEIVSIRNPAKPVLLGQLRTRGYVFDVAVSGNFAYLADHKRGILKVDVSDPQNPRLVKVFKTKGHPYGVDVENPFVYIADGEAGLGVLNEKTGDMQYSNSNY